MRERRLAELELQPFDWYAHLGEPARPLAGAEGERLFRREAARVRRYGGVLTVMSLAIVAPEVPRIDALSRIGELVTSVVRDCDFVAEGERDELLIGLPGADSSSARICLTRLACRIMELPPVSRVSVSAGIAQMSENESVEDTVGRARRDRS